MSVVLILIAVAALALCLLVWLLSRLRDDSRPSSFSKPASATDKPAAAVNSQAQPQASLSNKELPAHADKAPEANKDVSFRMQGERGMGGPIFGDVMCADGVYLPHVWENDYAISFDGRWIRTGAYAGAVPRLIDRKTKRCWWLSQPGPGGGSSSRRPLPHLRAPRARPAGSVGQGLPSPCRWAWCSARMCA